MNLELVPCKFMKDNSEVIAFVIRNTASSGTIISTTSSPPTTSIPKSSVAKPPKIKPRKSDPAIAPKRLDSLPPKILPATAATNGVAPILPAPRTTSNGGIPALNGQNGIIGSFIELPLTALTSAASTSSTNASKPAAKPRSKSIKPKSKAKPVEEQPLTAPPSLPSTSFEMQSPPQLLPETNGSYAQAPSVTTESSSPPSFLPPINAVSNGIPSGPSTSYQQQVPQQRLSSNGCTTDDLNAIEIAHSLSNDHKASAEYWENQQPQPHSSSHDHQYYNYDSTYNMYNSNHHHQPQHPPIQSSSNTGSNGYHSNFHQDYGNHDQMNGYCQSNGHFGQHHQNNTSNGHHHGNNGHWVPQPRQLQQQQQQYAQNQMTSSTPDSGIQSIDGSPPSTSAFTPPMVSPYPLQTNHYDAILTQSTMTVSSHQQQQQQQLPPSGITQFSAGPMDLIRNRHCSDGAPQLQSHIQLPPLNCMLPSNQTTSIPTIDKSYLDHQQPSCSYQNESLLCDTELDDITLEPMKSISPPGLEHEKSKEMDSDNDYSDMPILDQMVDKQQHHVGEVRASSRISQAAKEEEEEEKAEKKSEEPTREAAIAIHRNMDVNEIAKALMSTLPSEKVQELLRSFRPAVEEKEEEEDNAPTPSTSKVIPPSEVDVLPKKDESEKEEEKKENPRRGRQRKNSRKSSQTSGLDATSTNERPSTRSSTRNPSPLKASTPPPPPPVSTAVRGKRRNSRAAVAAKKPTQLTTNSKTLSSSSSKSKNNSAVRTTTRRASKAPKKSQTKTKKVSIKKSRKKGEKTVVTILKAHPFSRTHRPSHPVSNSQKFKLVDAVIQRSQPTHSSKASFYGFGSSRLDRPLPKEFSNFISGPSKLTTNRYEGSALKLAQLLERTHLNIPKIDMGRWEPTGAWKSAFNGNRKRKASAKSHEPPKKTAKIERTTAKKSDKFGPLKITIRRDSNSSDAATKKKKVSIITPVPKDIDYVKIRSNVIVEPPPKLTTASKPCECDDSDPCTSTSGCLSRTAHIECTHYSCQLFDTCQNRRLESNLSVHQLQIFKHPQMNHGVRSLTDISKDQLVCEFVGEVMRKNTYLKRLESGQSVPHYGIELIPGSYVIDAAKKGNLSRFMNHSCEPNCVMQRWVVRGEQRIGIFALKNIESGVELTYDYSMHVYLKEKIRCQCENRSCRGVISSMPPPAKAPVKPEKLTKSESQLIKKNGIFLRRNLRKYNTEREIPLPSPVPSMPEVSKCLIEIFNKFVHSCDKLPRRWLQHFSITTRKVFETAGSDTVEFIERFDANIKACLALISKSLERRQVDTLQHQYLHFKRQSNISDSLKDLYPNTLLSFLAERPKSRKNDHSPRILSATTDLSYMNSEYPVGSYDPDKESLLFSQKCSPDGDSIRCVCGIMDEGGEMYQCDQCHYWLHKDCLNLQKEPEEYICPFCEGNLKSTPLLDILLAPQPEYRIEGCVYYKTLVNCRGIQARVNECVYVERIINDEYKRRLKKFHEECVDGKTKSKKRKLSMQLPPNVEEPPESLFKPESKKLFDRKDLRTFRIERLFKVPTGERYAFGCYYARPHETFVDPGRNFYKNELFWTPLFDTLPLDVIAGRCLCLEPQEFATGRPKGPKYLEDDVFVCEYSIDKTQKVFEKINLKNRYHINTAEYLFDKFDKPLSVKRNFTPFVIKTDNKKTNEKNSKNKVSTVAKQTSTIRLHQCMDNLTSKP